MKSTLTLSCFVSFVLSAAISAEVQADAVVSLPAYQVNDSPELEFRFTFNPTTKILSSLFVSSVTPFIAKQGLRKGDRVMAIEGKSISKMAVDELPSLTSGKTLIFTIQRGGFRKQSDVPVTFPLKDQKKPNKAPEPTPTSVTPPAAQESRRP